MRIHNVYEDANGESHFRDIEVDWVDDTASAKMSKRLRATGIVVCEFTASVHDTWHRAPRRQYVINLAGNGERDVTLAKAMSSTRTISPGAMWRVSPSLIRRVGNRHPVTIKVRHYAVA
jgi:hypothetical protein